MHVPTSAYCPLGGGISQLALHVWRRGRVTLPHTDNHHRVASGAPPKLSDDPFNKLSTAKSVLRVPIANTCEGLTSILATPMNEQDFILVRDKIMGLPTTDKNKRLKCMNTRDYKHNLEKRAT